MFTAAIDANNGRAIYGVSSIDGITPVAIKVDPITGALIGENDTAYITQIDYNSGTNPVYVGIAGPGTPTSSALWQIKKITYDTNNNVTAVQYAGGTPNFNQIYNNRASLSYS